MIFMLHSLPRFKLLLFKLLRSHTFLTTSAITLVLSLSIGTVWTSPVQARSVQQIINRIKRAVFPSPPEPSPGGKKGPESILSPGRWGSTSFCQVACMVWHVRPVILYQGSVNANSTPDQVRIILDETEEEVETFEIEKRYYARLAISKDLIPGKVYRILQIKNDRVRDRSVTFQVMPDGEKRESIAKDLAAIEEKVKPDDRLEAKIQYFMDQQLWSDMLQELSGISTLPVDWVGMQEATVDRWKKDHEARTRLNTIKKDLKMRPYPGRRPISEPR
jgi:hypothetical protein